jgi:hypothetical protein
MSQAITIRIHDATGVVPLGVKKPWEELLKQAPPFQQLLSYEWYDSWAQTCAIRPPWTSRIRVLEAVSETGQTVGLLPLAFRREKGVTFLSLAGYFQPVRGLLCLPEMAEVVCRALVGTLINECRDWSALRFGPFDTATQERLALVEQLRSVGLRCLVIPRNRTIVAQNIPDSFEEYARLWLGHQFAKDIRYFERRLRREGHVDIRHFHNPQEPDITTLLEGCGEIERNSWLFGAGGNVRFQTDTDRDFWRQAISRSLSPRGQFDAWVLYFNDKAVSFSVTITVGPYRYMIANQFDEAFKKHSTGSILYFHAFEDACRSGVRFVDFAPGDLHYKSRFGGKETDLRMEVLAFRRSLVGFLLAGAIGSLYRLRKLLGSTPSGRRVNSFLPKI